ncbi:bacillithiol biosynthesis cysteine-adding enzyme BshC [Pseudalkalibacillus hwajinpoensis]|uniref:bacillithiol biosynthesis cysteine-adding enzyme BshC n=1 Tax=Guptibacillus hwajinpoensis TaxID=208199 RepID=UPI001CD31CC4|nr:bacillithiol biosynthesis cysteine-adding enzyme BshC [Pseudalkalibacillus hwajinpoensis]MCA0990127.1 bacillithiol biosynthesis cysteine-adding enzyme BshC [Pseudalkalibacillus hwajinpoensis]
MRLRETFLPGSNVIATDYIAEKTTLSAFFDYTYQRDSSYGERYKELMERHQDRANLTEHLMAFNEKFEAEGPALRNIERLQQPESVTVVAGQQAGVLTGPLYTINKAISVIKLAEEKERKLGVPVIPIFWVAGEDHDYHEVNHIYLYDEGRERKEAVPQKQMTKQALSDISLDHNAMNTWTRDMLKRFGETSYTKEIQAFLEGVTEKSTTYVDHFCYIMTKLFSKHGLVLVDSGNKDFRQLQTDAFKQMIHQNETINEGVLTQAAHLREENYPIGVDLDDQQANLFVKVNGERILLERLNGRFEGKTASVSFSKEELLDLAERQPEELSNNVVTRPIMQDLMFPVLGFVAGPGELAYWALLKPAFHSFGIKMPVIVPRLTFTFVERHIQKYVADLSLTDDEILKSGIEHLKETYMRQLDDVGIGTTFNDAKVKVEEIHQNLRDLTESVDHGLGRFAEKNGRFLQRQLDLLQQKLYQSLEYQHENTLAKFDEVGFALKPNGAPQERKWNVVYYLNWHGLDFVDQMMDLELPFNDQHKVIYL